MSTSFELVLDDTSPTINYYPFAETLGAPNLLAGWNSFFSDSGFLTELGQTGAGESLHITSLDGAVFTIQWFGTGIQIFGSVENAAYQVSLDGESPSTGLPRQDLLVEFQGLYPKQHLIALMAHPRAAAFNTTSNLAFDRAVLNISTTFTGASISSEPVDITSPRWSFSGDWEVLPDPDLIDKSNQTNRVSRTHSDTASITFTGSAVTLTGIRNFTHGHYNVTLDGTTTMFDGHSDWLETSTLFLQAGLDESSSHTLTVTNADDADLIISGINITHVSGGTPIADSFSSGVSTGTIIGIVFAIILGVIVIMTFVAWIYFRRRNRNRSRGISSAKTPHNLLASPSGSLRFGKGRYMLQDTYDAPPHTATEAEKGRRDQSIVLLANVEGDDIQPTSPLPYLRFSKTTVTSGRGNGRSQLNDDPMAGNLETVVHDTSDARLRAQSDAIYSSESSSTVGHDSLHAQGTHVPLRVEIPHPKLGSKFSADTQTSPRAGPRRPLILRSPRRGGDSRRSMLGSPARTLDQRTSLPSVSTIRFGKPWEDGAEEEPGASTTTEVVPPDHSHDRTTRRSLIGRGLSNWVPPW